MISFRSAVLGAALLLGAAGAASAQNSQEEAMLRQSCSNDYMRLCAAYDPDSPQVEQCFRQRMKELSPQCQSAIAAYSKANPQGRRR